MTETVKNIIIVGIVTGIISMLPISNHWSKYLRFTASGIIAVCCIIPLVKTASSLEYAYPSANSSEYSTQYEKAVIYKCREKLEEEIASALCGKFKNFAPLKVSLMLNCEDTSEITIEKADIYVSENTSSNYIQIKEFISELIQIDTENINIIPSGG